MGAKLSTNTRGEKRASAGLLGAFWLRDVSRCPAVWTALLSSVAGVARMVWQIDGPRTSRMRGLVQQLEMRLLAALMALICCLTTGLFARALFSASESPPPAAGTRTTLDELPAFLMTTGR